MTSTIVPALVPSFGTTSGDGSSSAVGAPGLPLANVEQPPPRRAVHSIRAVDTNGRVMDQAILRALGWGPGDRLVWRVRSRLIVITRPGYGQRGIRKYGHLSLPVEARRGAGIEYGDRVLLAADPDHGLLVVFPPDVLDEVLARRFAEGERR